MKIAALLTAGLLLAAPAWADDAASPNPAKAGDVVVDSHQRFSPGLGVWLAGEGRGYEGLSGAAAGAGVGIGYSWDLVSVQLEYTQSIADVVGYRPGSIKLGTDFAFFTLGKVSAVGRAALDVMVNPPNCQLAPLDRVGTDCVVTHPGPMIGPELGAGARYRWNALFDLYANLNADIVMAYNGPRQFFFNPGLEAGIVLHPFGKEP